MASAVDVFYRDNLIDKLPKVSVAPSIDMKQAEALFNKYQRDGEMDEDQIEQFFADIGVNAGEDIVALLISLHMGARKMGTYEKAEFIKGCQHVGADSVAGWKKALPRLYTELTNESQFLKVYKFTFKFAAAQAGYNNIDIETANALWDLLLPPSKCGFLKKWQAFLATEKKALNALPNDTWDLFYTLVAQTKGDLSKFEDDGAWPSLIDEFILYTQK